MLPEPWDNENWKGQSAKTNKLRQEQFKNTVILVIVAVVMLLLVLLLICSEKQNKKQTNNKKTKRNKIQEREVMQMKKKIKNYQFNDAQPLKFPFLQCKFLQISR